MASVFGGPYSWSSSRGQDGHTDYHVVLLVKSAINEGPDAILNAGGLPAIGAPYAGSSLPATSAGIITDFNPWAFRWPNAEVSIHQEKKGEGVNFHEIDLLFSTRPLERCMTQLPSNPLSEPPKIGGSFTKYTREALVDRFGNPIWNSSLENITGQVVERDYNTASVTIEMNFANFGGGIWAPMIDTLNDSTLWGLPPRCVKLSNVRWQRKLYSVCTFFYNFTYEFDINFETFDRLLADKGTRVLAPGGNPFNPGHYIVYQDLNGNLVPVTLDGSGNAWSGISPSYTITTVTNAGLPQVFITTNPANPFSSGDQVIITGVQGPILVNGTWSIDQIISPTVFVVTAPNLTSLPTYIGGSGICGSINDTTAPGSLWVQFYDESNFLLLGIPSSL
jgi:hypothetical protein